MRVAIQDPTTGAHLRINADGTLAVAALAGETQSAVGGATEVTLLAILAELAQKLESGGQVSLSAATLSALENTTVTVANFPSSQPVTGTVSVSNFPSATGLTDTQLRANPLSVSVTNHPASQPVTDGGGSLTIDGSVSVSNLPATQSVSGTVAVSNLPATQPVSGSVSVANFPSTQPISGTVTVANPVTPSTLAVTATGAAGAAVTLTLPAVALSYHYLTRLEICLFSTAARAGSATPVVVTTTNLPGLPAFTFPSAGAIGTTELRVLELHAAPLKSTTLNVPTTVICPIVTSALWRVTATYFTGA